MQARKKKKLPVIRRQIFHAYNRIVLEEIRDKLDGFLTKHGASLRDIVFECDSDCIGLARDAGLRYRHTQPNSKVEVYILADIIAWLNTNGRELKGIVVMDITKRVLAKLEKDLLK